MFGFAILAVLASGLLAFGLARLFARRAAWLPVVVTAVIPPLIFIPYGIFTQLVAIGANAGSGDQAPPHAVDDFASGLETLLADGLIWFLVALAVSSFVVQRVRLRSSGTDTANTSK